MLQRVSFATIPLLLLAVAASGPAWTEEQAEPEKPKLEYLYMALKGVESDDLAVAVERGLKAVEGVQSLVWTSPRAEAKIVRIVGQAADAKLLAACQSAGVPGSILAIVQRELTLGKQMHCNGCVTKVTRALKSVRGVKEVHVAEDRIHVSVVYDSKVATVAQLERAVADVGYPVRSDR